MDNAERKRGLKAELVAALVSDLDTRERAHQAALEGATHEEAKPENDKDTRALEQSYLARGQALRIEELRAQAKHVEWMQLPTFGADDAVGIGALVAVDDEGEVREYFVAEHGGGTVLDAGRVRVLNPASPLGRALIGKRAGDDCEVRIDGRRRELVIVRVD